MFAPSRRTSSLHSRSLSQPTDALGIQRLDQRRDSETSHCRTSSSPSCQTFAHDSSPKIPELSPKRLSRQFNASSYSDSVDSPRLSMDFSRPTPPLQSPSRASARHSRTLSSSSSTSVSRILNGSEFSTSRSHSRQLSSVSLHSNSSDLRRPSQELLARSLQPRQYNFPENYESPPLSESFHKESTPEEQNTYHADVRKPPPMVSKRQYRHSQALPRQNVPGSPLREQAPQMTSVWLDDDFSKLNRSKSSATKPRSAPAQVHRKHASVSESPRTPMSPSTSRSQSKVFAPSDAATRLAAAASINAPSPVEQSPKSRTPRSLRRLIGSLSPLRFSPRKSASPQSQAPPQAPPQAAAPQPEKTKRKPNKAPTPPVASPEAARSPKSLQSAIDFNGAHKNLSRPRPSSMVYPPTRPGLASPVGPNRPARPSPNELLDATDMRRLSTDFNRRSIVYSPVIPQSPTFMTSPQIGSTSSPKMAGVDRRCMSAVSTLSNGSDPSTHTGSRTSLLVDGNLASRSPRIAHPTDQDGLRIRNDPEKLHHQDPRLVSESAETWI